MERELYNILLSEVSKFETSVSNKDQLVYGLRKKVGSHWGNYIYVRIIIIH